MAVVNTFARSEYASIPRLGASAVAVGLMGLILHVTPAFAAGNSPPAFSGARSLLADLIVLPDSDLARESGRNLRGPEINHGVEGHAPIVLWDELKVPAQASIGSSGINVTINGSK